MKTRNMIHKYLLGSLLLVWFGSSAHGFYDPAVGRWLNRDPLGDSRNISLPVEEMDGANLYTFIHNSPADLVDPDGLISVSPCQAKPGKPGCPSGWESQWTDGNPGEKAISRRYRCYTLMNACNIKCSDKYEDLDAGDKDCADLCKADCKDKMKKCIKGMKTK